jgi:spoIIIJ-associated protein
VTDIKYTVTETGPKIETFLERILPLAGLNVTFDITDGETAHHTFETPDLVVRFVGDDVDILVANKAEVMLALEHLTMEILGVPSDQHSRLCFDANDHRLLRIEELRMSAVTIADKVLKTQVPYQFNPMNSRERRIIHLALRDFKQLRSESLGQGQFRHVVVLPVDAPSLPEPPPPAIPFRRPGGLGGGGMGSSGPGGFRGGDRGPGDRRGGPGSVGGGGDRGPRRPGGGPPRRDRP